jgi:hypothetical protein
MSIIDTSDKVFWHGFVDFYENFFRGRVFENIAEIGIFKGNSIRWLLERFPSARICAADILEVQPEWPVDERFSFFQLDQGNVEALREFYSQADFDLIIEDGSHFPRHQVVCLVEGLKALRAGGLYVLEDVHTSHPAFDRGDPADFKDPGGATGNALSVLLAIDHYKRISRTIDSSLAETIAHGSIMRAEDVLYLSQVISTLSLYKRTRLPDYCYSCGSEDYDFSSYKCRCGVEIFSDSDSMTFVIEKKSE